MHCPQCSTILIETKEDQPISLPLGVASQYLVSSGSNWVPSIGGATWATSAQQSLAPPTPQNTETIVYNCPKCHISIKIDDGKKSREKKELLFIIEALVEKRKQCNAILDLFNIRWGDNQTIEKLEALLMLK